MRAVEDRCADRRSGPPARARSLAIRRRREVCRDGISPARSLASRARRRHAAVLAAPPGDRRRREQPEPLRRRSASEGRRPRRRSLCRWGRAKQTRPAPKGRRSPAITRGSPHRSTSWVLRADPRLRAPRRRCFGRRNLRFRRKQSRQLDRRARRGTHDHSACAPYGGAASECTAAWDCVASIKTTRRRSRRARRRAIETRGPRRQLELRTTCTDRLRRA